MTGSSVRVGVGTRFLYDGDPFEVVDMQATTAGNELVLRGMKGRRDLLRVSLRELLTSERARVIPELPGPSSDDPGEPASVVLAELTESERVAVRERAAHIRETLTGYRSGSAELAGDGEPRAQFDPSLPLVPRYEAKAAELDVSLRTIKQWVADFRQQGEAGLVRTSARHVDPLGRVDDRWTQIALEVMAEEKDQSRPTRSIVIDRANARVVARFGEGAVQVPSRATAFRVLTELERRQPTFRLSTKRNRERCRAPFPGRRARRRLVRDRGPRGIRGRRRQPDESRRSRRQTPDKEHPRRHGRAHPVPLGQGRHGCYQAQGQGPPR